MNPGSMTVDGLMNLTADVTVERDNFEKRVKELEELLKKEKESGSYWYDLYGKEVKKVSEMRESMQTILRVSNEICERWKG